MLETDTTGHGELFQDIAERDRLSFLSDGRRKENRSDKILRAGQFPKIMEAVPPACRIKFFPFPRYAAHFSNGFDRQRNTGTNGNGGGKLENQYAAELLPPGTEAGASIGTVHAAIRVSRKCPRSVQKCPSLGSIQGLSGVMAGVMQKIKNPSNQRVSAFLKGF